MFSSWYILDHLKYVSSASLFLFTGDIRRLEAVDIPALHKLKNVIVFPVDGPRPHPLEMSGGDLDGDTFWICNDEQLIFESNEEPFDYQDQTVEAERKAQLESRKQFTIEDICNFFGEYIKADK
jgi:RNA-dependent RNA polymerase